MTLLNLVWLILWHVWINTVHIKINKKSMYTVFKNYNLATFFMHIKYLQEDRKMLFRFSFVGLCRHTLTHISTKIAALACSPGEQQPFYYAQLPVDTPGECMALFACISGINNSCFGPSLGQADLSVFLCTVGCLAEKLPPILCYITGNTARRNMDFFVMQDSSKCLFVVTA